MSTYNPTYQTPYQPPPSNALGIAGFVVSLTGLVVCVGLLCPIGLVMSLIALRKEPRGFAVAGAIVGVLGSLLAATILLMVFQVIPSTFAAFNMFGPQMTTQNNMYSASNEIDNYFTDNGDTLPDAVTGTALINYYTDGYGHAMEYRPAPAIGPDMYELVSPGEDGVFGNADDYVEPMQAYNWNTGYSSSMPMTQPLVEEIAPAQVDYSFEQAANKLASAFPVGAALPAEADGTAALTNQRDVWGQAIQYSPTNNPPMYHLKSAGPDRTWLTEDDIVKSFYFEPTGGQ